MADIHVSGVNPEAAARLAKLVTNNGSLTVEAILDDAADTGSPLHQFFEWSDTEAARKYRETQARGLIRRVKVEVIVPDKTEPIHVRAYVSRTDIGTAGAGMTSGSYIPIQDIAGDTAESVLRSIRRDIERLKTKYSAHSELLKAEISGAFGS